MDGQTYREPTYPCITLPSFSCWFSIIWFNNVLLCLMNPLSLSLPPLPFLLWCNVQAVNNSISSSLSLCLYMYVHACTCSVPLGDQPVGAGGLGFACCLAVDLLEWSVCAFCGCLATVLLSSSVSSPGLCLTINSYLIQEIEIYYLYS